MNYPRNMNELFGKLNDLKAVFVYGQKIIPVIQNLIDFMKDTVPLLENINRSIEESTSKIPTAKDKINNISSATELATTEILDIVDDISENLEKVNKLVSDCIEWEKERKKKLNKIKELVDNELALKLVGELFEEDLKVRMDEILSIVNKISEANYRITLSLQVQDITSQQLAAVNHLIESVQYKLTALITDFENVELEEIKEEHSKQEMTFDENANYFHKKENQDVVDKLFDKKNDNTTQDEIDKLFSEM